ncbi:MAG: hypothetical protein JSU69_11875 [Candidatus Zixiibacteriota bacterium]|nr:MAG: hypothetical protein JSU69_11875 [candidate division Zixibacteria bacterium]
MMSEQKDRYIVTIDDREFDINLTRRDGGFIVENNNSTYKVSVDQLSDKKFLFKIDDSSSEVDIARNGSLLEIFLEGKEMNVRVEPFNLAELRKRAGAAIYGQGDKIIKAPMPGLVLASEVKMGERIVKGKTLIIIEAMKMENTIKAPHDAVIKEVFVTAGQAVDKGEKLVELE